ncbi:MazG nucleotide pyrophosphohydrolase domain-containing protein [Chlamydia vaughanii]|uniref:MazG nucleotide pyrophosphohydrolase domain-containing protein n=1 Tax=Chlamydia vaughanii TaxID=3112552 RepID=UPI0032B1F384
MKDINFPQLIELARKMVMDGVCPWTDQQNFDSLIKCILGECDELSEAVHEGHSTKEITSEAGDVLILILMLCYKLESLGLSTVEGIITEAVSKIRRRAPHVFSSKAISYEEARKAWALGKLQEKSEK